MAESEFSGMYEYMGFTIWNVGKNEWVAEPDWDIEAIEKYKYDMPKHETIAKAKKWVKKIGVNLKEKDYLK